MTSPSAESGCSVKRALPSLRKTVSVNGNIIPHAAIARETQNHPAERPVDAWQAATRALVVRELLLQEAKRLGIAPDPIVDDAGRRETDEEAAIRALVEREVVTPEPDQDSCRRYYQQNRQRFQSPNLYEVRHILIPVRGEDEEARQRAMALAQSLCFDLAERPAAFAELALAHSACPSRDVGGNLGQIGPGQTVPEFEAGLAALEVGAIAKRPIETRYGYHVVALDRRIDGTVLPFELVHARVARWLAETVRRSAIRQYITVLAGRAEIMGIQLAGSQSPLVQ
jgi:peptidyl-prolyl cis-trans isomerase C